MLNFLPPPLIGVLAVLCLAINTLILGVAYYALVITKFLIRSERFRLWSTAQIIRVIEYWIMGIGLEMKLLGDFKWDVQGLEGLRLDHSYLVCANHQSWVDIVILNQVFNRRIPFIRFFLKRELQYLPVIGPGIRALDFPMMRRYSKEELERDPRKRTENLETVRRACALWGSTPVTVLNFLEGTRLTPEKHAAQNSPYQHLLKPKAGGVAIVIEAMGERFHALLDVTIHYAGGPVTFVRFLTGQVREITVRVSSVPIPPSLLGGDYEHDKAYRLKMQQWITEIWQQKDRILSRAFAGPAEPHSRRDASAK